MKNLIEEQAINCYNALLESYKGRLMYQWLIQDKDQVIDSIKESLPLECNVKYFICTRIEDKGRRVGQFIVKFVRSEE